jgi:predicted dehydrogenase
MLAGDSGHTVEFARRLNHVGIDEEQWVAGARVVAAVQTTSQIEPDRIPGYVDQLRECGVELVVGVDELVGLVDAVLIETQDGGDHLTQALPFIQAGVPTFVDKPLATSTAAARQIVEAAQARGLTFGSSSALRHALEVQDVPLGRRCGTIDAY